MRVTRRATVGGLTALALAGCERRGSAEAETTGVPPLKAVASFPVGMAAMTAEFADPQWVALATRNFSQITPAWEMKMERILAEDGSLKFDAADAIAAFCRRNRLGLHAHTLVWYQQDPPWFERLKNDPRVFRNALGAYARAVMGRYRGLARGWDVVNEAVAEDGNGYRGGVWAEGLGPDFARVAFEIAREADPDAVLFLNDYNLEILPAKLDAFQRLLENLLEAGAPVTGVGTQSHLDIGLAPGEAGRAVRALSRFGLPIHVSELDISTNRGASALFGPMERLEVQARVASEIAEAFMGLPPSQRYAFTLWGVEDKDSWLRHQPGGVGDAPLLFDDEGQPKPACRAVADAFAGRARGG